MVGIVVISPLSLPSLLKPSSRNLRLNSRICFPERIPPNQKAKLKSLATFSHFSNQNVTNLHSHLPIKAASSSSSSSAEYIEEPTTNVKFQTLLRPPGGTALLSLLGIGYREKVFAIIGVKVYAAGLYVNQCVFTKLDNWKGRTATEIQEDSSIFLSIFQAPVEKSLQIVLVRDVDGKTFWNALDESVSPRIKSLTPVDELALSTFSNVFRGRSLKKGTSIFLTWLNLNKMLVSVSSDGMPSGVDATIGSANVTFALFDVFLGANAVSPTLKASVANGLEKAIN